MRVNAKRAVVATRGPVPDGPATGVVRREAASRGQPVRQRLPLRLTTSPRSLRPSLQKREEGLTGCSMPLSVNSHRQSKSTPLKRAAHTSSPSREKWHRKSALQLGSRNVGATVDQATQRTTGEAAPIFPRICQTRFLTSAYRTFRFSPKNTRDSTSLRSTLALMMFHISASERSNSTQFMNVSR